MDNKIITFGDTKIEKRKFNRYKNPFFLKILNIDNIFISNKISSGEINSDYFISYKDGDYKINLYSIIVTKTSAYVKRYACETKWM